MRSKSLTRGLIAVPVAALALGVAALSTAAFAGGSDVAAPSVGYAAANAPAAAGLAPTTTSRDWNEVQVSVVRPPRRRF